MNEPKDNDLDPADEGVSRRLAKLRIAPVETAAFDERVERALQEEVGDQRRWLLGTRYRAAAAGIAVFLTVGAVLTALAFSAQPARASEERLVEIYKSSVAQHGASVPVHTFEEARATLREKWAGAPGISEADAKELRVMSCCVHEVGRKQMASVTFLLDGAPVTAAVARSEDIRPPSAMKTAGSVNQRVTSSKGGINMVMQERNGVWTCVMGRLSTERLGDLLNSLQNESH